MPPYGSKRIYLPARSMRALAALEQDWAKRYANGTVDTPRYPVSRLFCEVIEDEAKLIGWREDNV